MPINATQLRKDVYHILDKALKTGKPVEIERKGQVFTLFPPTKKSCLEKLKKLKNRNILTEPIEYYDHIDWYDEWKGFQDL